MRPVAIALCLVVMLPGCSSSSDGMASQSAAGTSGQAGAKGEGGSAGSPGSAGSGGSAGSPGKAVGANRCTVTQVDPGYDGIQMSSGAEGTHNEASALYLGPAGGSRVLCSTQDTTLT